jgi:hypothetical protein
MTTVFIAGSMTIKRLDRLVQERMINIIVSDYDIVVGDADGVDSSIQLFLADNGARRVTVYCTGDRPRNNVGEFPVHSVKSYHSPGSRAYFTAKDIDMAKAADYGLMIWDAKSTGTLSNVIELLTNKKYSLVFVNKDKVFKSIKNVLGLEELVACMSESARLKADAKMGLVEKIEALRSRARQAEILDELRLKAKLLSESDVGAS